jgi:flagellar biosynthesis/type III secretory pathway protein FliH
MFIPSKKNFDNMSSEAKTRYNENNPYISFNVPAEEKIKASKVCKEMGIAISQLARKSFLDALKQTHQKELEEAKKTGFEEGSRELEALNQKHEKKLEETRKRAFLDAKNEFDRALHEWYNHGYGAGQTDGYKKGFEKGYIYRRKEELDEKRKKLESMRQTPKKTFKQELTEIWQSLEKAN